MLSHASVGKIGIWLRCKGQVKKLVLWKRPGLKIRQIAKQAGQSRDPAELTRSVGSTANHCWRLWEFLCEGGARAGQSTPAVTGVDWDIVFLRNLLNDNQLDLLRKVFSKGTSLEFSLGILTKFIQWRNLHLYLMQKLYNHRAKTSVTSLFDHQNIFVVYFNPHIMLEKIRKKLRWLC